MVGNRPFGGVRNSVCSISTSSSLRAKNAGAGVPESGGATQRQPLPGNHHPTVSPVRLLEAAPITLNEKEY
jgi:hypothetical protein